MKDIITEEAIKSSIYSYYSAPQREVKRINREDLIEGFKQAKEFAKNIHEIYTDDNGKTEKELYEGLEQESKANS